MDIAIQHINTATTASATIQSEESRLIEACLRSERWAQKRLYELHYGKLMAVCLR